MLAGDGLLNLAYETMLNAISELAKDYKNPDTAEKWHFIQGQPQL